MLTYTEVGSKSWWRLVKSYLKTHSGSPKLFPQIKHNNIAYENPTDIANVLNDYFVGQALVENPDKDLPNIPQQSESIDSIILTQTEIRDQLLSVDVSKANGPDNISNKFIKLIAPSLTYPLTILFNRSLSLSLFPQTWKKANVMPIHKKGSVNLCSNYRPIALTSCLSKIFERCVFKHVYNFFLDHNVISVLQSGFKPGDSTAFQLIDIYNTILQAIDNGKEVRAVFCDISKAFDRVWHSGLLAKLNSCGIRGKLLAWFNSYLSDRSQTVVINGFHSVSKPVLAGVPQGSVLGPLLFLVYINDLTTGITSNIRLFADDTSLFIVIEDARIASDVINNDLRIISQWANDWQVKFSPEKTEAMLFTRKQVPSTKFDLKLNEIIISEVEQHKHLGVLFQSNCSWHSHVKQIATKVGPLINCLRSLKYRLTRRSLELLYKSYILPIFDYCDHVWANCTQEQERNLEKLNLDAIRTICGSVRGTSHEKLYQETGLCPLAERRKQHKLCIFYKMVHGLTPNYLSVQIPNTVYQANRYNLRNANNLQQTPSKTELHKNIFFPSTIKAWNELDEDIKMADNITKFKSMINPNRKRNDSLILFCNFGQRCTQVILSRLRLGCSDLNGHKYTRHLLNDSSCSCGHTNEDPAHYFLTCNKYVTIRSNKYFYLQNVTIEYILDGSKDDIPVSNPELILSSVHEFISQFKRFVI